MPQLTVYKASAGSGKTFRLTVEYLKLLLKNPESYRHILAVTFTNKATTEMKERILKSLSELSRLDTSMELNGIAKVVGTELTLAPKQIKAKAQLALSFLLHDYGRFRIETIDGFFQSILRNLARELGLGAWLNIELNNDLVLSEAVDNLIDKAEENTELLQWITDYIEEKLTEGKSWKIDQELKKFGLNIFRESFKEKEGILKEKLSDKDFLKNYKRQLRLVEKNGLEQLQKASADFFTILEANNLVVSDFSRNTTGPCSYFIKLQKGVAGEKVFTQSYVQAALEDASKWSNKTSELKERITSLAETTLNPLLLETESTRAEHWKAIVSARLASKHLNQVGLLSDIAAEVGEINLENHQFLLSNTNALLKSLLEGSDASFIYEKTGIELNHILFDEFQDTSRMQWETFKPLLQEGLANGNDSLIVGDEKQSIYRWRNGDWRILGNIKAETAPAVVVEKTLNSNWRSSRNIVAFNNSLFATLEANLNDMHENLFGHRNAELAHAYSDIAQQAESKDEKGLVSIAFISSNQTAQYEQQVFTQMIHQVETLQQNGVAPHDIAILIRYNKEIPKIGAYFSEYKSSVFAKSDVCYEIVSDDAFLLSSSKSIQTIIDALQLLNDPINPIHQALLKLDYQGDVQGVDRELHSIFKQNKQPLTSKVSEKTSYKNIFSDNTPTLDLLPVEFVNRFIALQRLPLYELVEELYRIFELHRIPAQDSYLHCFLDKLGEYIQYAPANIGDFLTHWDEKMSRTSIPAGSAINGIRILSIHKSKGLEFHTVLLPFCDWKLKDVKENRVWCQPQIPPYNQLDLLPIDYNELMAESIFDAEYMEETLQLWVDALNLLYVAFTRAKFNLYVWSAGNDLIKKYEGPKTVGHFIQDQLKEGILDLSNGVYREAKPIDKQIVSTLIECNSEEIEDVEDSETVEALFEFGSFNAGEPETLKAEKAIDIQLRFQSFAHKTKFRQSNKSRAFCKGMESDDITSSYIDRGNLLHKLFQGIEKKEDLDQSIQRLILEGLLNSQEAKKYWSYAAKALDTEEVRDWYSGKYRLYNECSILCTGQDGKMEMKRPDRVMFGEKEVLVVDFKFGKPKPSHQIQIKTYCDLLSGMGHSNVKGYLWYVDESRIEHYA